MLLNSIQNRTNEKHQFSWIFDERSFVKLRPKLHHLLGIGLVLCAAFPTWAAEKPSVTDPRSCAEIFAEDLSPAALRDQYQARHKKFHRIGTANNRRFIENMQGHHRQ